MTEATQVEAPVAPATIEIDDLNQFVQILAGWHEQKVKTLRHMVAIPDGSEMVVGEENPTTVILTGDMLAGFKAGIELSLMELGELPFLYEAEPEEVVVPTATATADD